MVDNNTGKIQRIIQESVPGKQVTIAHIIANPDESIYRGLGIKPDGNAIGIMTITPSEAAIIASDTCQKVANIKVAFMDRFTGSLVITGKISSVDTAVSQAVNMLVKTLNFASPKITRS